MANDSELDYLKRKKLLEMQRASLLKKAEKTGKKERPEEKMDVKAALNKIFVGRAWEVWNTALRQFPGVMKNLGVFMRNMVDSDGLKGPITGEQLYWLLRRLGLRVRLKTKIRILESGEIKTIAEKLKEE